MGFGAGAIVVVRGAPPPQGRHWRWHGAVRGRRLGGWGRAPLPAVRRTSAGEKAQLECCYLLGCGMAARPLLRRGGRRLAAQLIQLRPGKRARSSKAWIPLCLGPPMCYYYTFQIGWRRVVWNVDAIVGQEVTDPSQFKRERKKKMSSGTRIVT
uniref:Uncharacterized protein n=2 Tax=Oryza punctata TaxID=4537 RepID=A0A0E0KA09_ORYPU